MERNTLSKELFLAGKIDSSLPSDLNSNPRLIEQAAARRNLYETFNRVFDGEEALLPKLWNEMSDFLEADALNSRIILYLPFEVLPDFNQEFVSSTAAEAANRFKDAYFDGWIRLLHESEPRANFVDGDILEPGLEEPERISKAGHLIPELLAKGMIRKDTVELLLEVIEEPELRQSLVEGTMVARDRGLLDMKISSVAPHKKSDKFYNNPDSPDISAGRARWLRKVEKQVQDEEEADKLAIEILGGGNPDKPEASIAILAAVKATKLLARGNLQNAREFIANAEDLFQVLWDGNDPEVKDTIISGLNQLAKSNIVDQDFLDRFGINNIDLTDVTVEESEFEVLQSSAKKVKEHPILSEYLYPGFLVFGSRVKGYAGVNSDLDAAMFFKPDVEFEKRDEILEILKTDLPDLNAENLLEFWTTREKGRLRFTVPAEETRIFVGSDQVHFFLGGLWIEHDRDLNEIRADLLHHYLYSSDKQLYLGLLEVDAVLCRVLHKGYWKLYPVSVREKTPNSDLIDYDSDFWDPGYRKVATKLFLSKVFLPDLS